MLFSEEEIIIDKSSYNGKKYSRPMGPNAPHYRNKEERKELARIAQKAGVSIEELLKNKDIRIKLSQAQVRSRLSTGNNKAIDLGAKRFKRIAAAVTGLPVWHEKIAQVYKDYLNEYNQRPWMLGRSPSKWVVVAALQRAGVQVN